MPGAPFFFSVPQAGRIRLASKSFRSTLTSGVSNRDARPMRMPEAKRLHSSSFGSESRARWILAAVTGVDVRHRARID